MPVCKGKTRYSSRERARKAMKRIPNSPFLRIYKCPECGKFHFGRHSNWSELRKEIRKLKGHKDDQSEDAA